MSHMQPFTKHDGVWEIHTDSDEYIMPDHVVDLAEKMESLKVEGFDAGRFWQTRVKQGTQIAETLNSLLAGAQDWEGITEVQYHPKMWVGRMSAPGYLDATDWCYSRTEQGIIKQLDELYGLELPANSSGYICSCPRCGDPCKDAALEVVRIEARVWETKFDPYILDAFGKLDFKRYELACSACGAQDIALGELVINLGGPRDE